MKILMKSMILQSAAWLMVLVDIPTAARARSPGPTLTDVHNELMNYTTVCHRPGSFRVGTSCYYIVLERMTWEQAETRCQSLSMELARPPDAFSGELRDYITQHHAKSVIGHCYGVWIGARAILKTHSWVSDGSPVKSDLIWPGAEAEVGWGDCLDLQVGQDYVNTKPPYSVTGCSEYVRVLCQEQYQDHGLCSRLPKWDCSKYKIQCPNYCS